MLLSLNSHFWPKVQKAVQSWNSCSKTWLLTAVCRYVLQDSIPPTREIVVFGQAATKPWQRNETVIPTSTTAQPEKQIWWLDNNGGMCYARQLCSVQPGRFSNKDITRATFLIWQLQTSPLFWHRPTHTVRKPMGTGIVSGNTVLKQLPARRGIFEETD